MVDRYTKFILTIIAGTLVYLCIVLTPIPGVHAQVPSLRPGEPSGPTEVVISGWRTPAGLSAFPVSIQHPVQVTSAQPLRITGSVTTERCRDCRAGAGRQHGNVRTADAALQRACISSGTRNYS